MNHSNNIAIVSSIRRQSRCGHCQEPGHNRRTCPVIAESRRQVSRQIRQIVAESLRYERQEAVQSNSPLERQDTIDSSVPLPSPQSVASPQLVPRSTAPPLPTPQPVVEVEPETTCVANPDEQDDCPICLCSFEKTNVFVPKCGHKICGDCFFNNIRTNKQTGTSCPMCRQTTVPSNTFTVVRQVQRVVRRSPNNGITRRPLSEVANAVQSEIELLNHSVRPFRPEPPTEGEVGQNYYNFITSLRNMVAPEISEELEVQLDRALVDIGFHFTVRAPGNRRSLISSESGESIETLYNRWNNELF